MKTFLDMHEGTLVSEAPSTAHIVVYADPDEAERKELLATLHLDRHDLESALDPDEISRLELRPEHTYIIWKRPNNVSFEEQLRFEVSSVGFFLQPDRLTVILGERTLPFSAKEFHKIGSLTDVVLKFLLHTIHHYLGHLKVIKQLTTEIQTKLNLSMENQYLLQMFTLGESLIYYINALEANTAVLTKLKACVEKLGLTKEQQELLDDVVIEHQQCCRQAEIYSTVLSGLMDARASIINNNMNTLLKNLTLINVVFLPLNLIAGIGGMSEFSMMTSHVSWKLSYALFTVGMIIFGWVTWLFLVKKIDKGRFTGTRRLLKTPKP